MPDNDVTLLRVQRTEKPKVEEVLPYFVEGDMLASALDFVALLRAQRMNPGWAGVHNAWRANSKGKPICYIRLGREWVRHTKNVHWVVILYLDNMEAYADVIHNESWQNIVWNDLHFCRHCAYQCSHEKPIAILGKEFFGLCPTFVHRVSFVNPDETTIEIITGLLRLEREARKSKGLPS